MASSNPSQDSYRKVERESTLMAAFSYSQAQKISQELQAMSPACTPMIADVPQRGNSKDLQFRITVWQGAPCADCPKFVFNTTDEWERLQQAMRILDLVPASHATRVTAESH
jgi:hypothetical protein